MKRIIFILAQSLCILLILTSCTSKTVDNGKSIEKCRELLKQAGKAPLTESALPLGFSFGMTKKEVYRIVDEQVLKGQIKKVNDFYYTDFVASDKKYKSLLDFAFIHDSLVMLQYIIGNKMVRFDSRNKKYVLDELNKNISLGYTFTNCIEGDVEKYGPNNLTENNYWIKNNLVIEFKEKDRYFYTIEYSNARTFNPIVGLNLMLGIEEEVKKEMEEKVSDVGDANTNSKAALAVIKAEPKVIEAFITDANVLYVSVQDDGTRRDGYAEYLCQIIKEHNAPINSVKVVKVGSTKDSNRDNAYGVLLGESYCK